MPPESLESALSRVLIDNLRPSLRDALAQALAAGKPPQQILARARRVTGGAQAVTGGLTYLSVLAFLAEHTGRPAEELDPENFGVHSA